MTEKKTRRRRAPADVAARALAKMPLGELHRFAEKLVRVDADVAAYLLERLRTEMLPPSTGAHGSGAAPEG